MTRPVMGNSKIKLIKNSELPRLNPKPGNTRLWRGLALATLNVVDMVIAPWRNQSSYPSLRNANAGRIASGEKKLIKSVN